MRSAFLSAMLFFIVPIGDAGAKPKPASRYSGQKDHVSRAAKRPDLTLPISEVSSLKIASRKSSYRIGEMIRIDIAILNRSNLPLYVRNLSWASLSLLEANESRPIPINRYMLIDRLVTPEGFEILMPGEFAERSVDILSVCDPRAFEQTYPSEDADAETRQFEQGQFINFGNACLKDLKGGTYKFTAVLQNGYVVISQKTLNHKTATGSIISAPLVISIIE